MAAEALITCTKCKKRTPMSQMRYSPNGEDLVCQSCTKPGMVGPKDSSTTMTKGMPSTMSPQLRTPPASSSPASSSSPPKNVHYQCTSCGYKFSRASRNEMVCPYCSRKSLRKESQLVSDVDELMGNLNTY